MITLIVEEQNETRLDRFLKRKFIYLTQGIIERSLRKKQIKLNNKNAQANTRVQKGDTIIIADYLVNEKNFSTEQKNYFSPATISLANKILKDYLIFSTREFIVINKPCGIAAQGGSKIRISIDHALQYLNQTKKSEYRLVHRLDKDTSGVFLIAANLNSAILLGEAFREKEIKKTYLAVVSGDASLLPRDGIIESYISKEKSGTHEVVKETKDGKFAKSLYKILAKDKTTALIEYTPLTGRMHQLRYHSKQLGFPILGDTKYGNTSYKRMMLHALEIGIPAKIFGQEYTIKAPLDNLFEFYLENLKVI